MQNAFCPDSYRDLSLSGMKPQQASSYPIAYRRLSYCVITVFICFWAATITNVYFRSKLDAAVPRANALYKVFWRQSWRLFAHTKLYNRQLNIFIRDSANNNKTDSVDIVQYSLAQKRKYAPFNNYEEGLDRILFTMMGIMERRYKEWEATVKKQSPGKPQEWYVLQASSLLLADTTHDDNLKNLLAFTKNMLQDEKISTAGKEYQLQLTYKYTPPQMPPAGSFSKGPIQIIFQTGYKPF